MLSGFKNSSPGIISFNCAWRQVKDVSFPVPLSAKHVFVRTEILHTNSSCVICVYASNFNLYNNSYSQRNSFTRSIDKISHHRLKDAAAYLYVHEGAYSTQGRVTCNLGGILISINIAVSLTILAFSRIIGYFSVTPSHSPGSFQWWSFVLHILSGLFSAKLRFKSKDKPVWKIHA